jgi:hypothetical protein
MLDVTISEFQVLKCDCGGTLFEPLVRLKYRSEGGTITEPAGHKCSACQQVVDNSYMIRLINNQTKLAEAARLVAEVQESEKATPKKEPGAVIIR